MPFPLPNRIAVITGASQGIGAAAARELARHGCRVALAARSEDLLNQIASEIQTLGGHALAIPTDVSDPAQIKTLARAVLDKWGRIDIWINNAGLNVQYDALFAKEEWVDQLFRVNLLAVYWGMRAAAHAMMNNEGAPKGIIVNVSTLATQIPPVPRMVLYQATKRAVDTMSEGIALEISPLDIKVINILPGWTATNFGVNMLGRKGVPAEKRGGVPPETVARRIAHAIQRGENNPRVIVTTKDRLLLAVSRVLPLAYRRYLGKRSRRKRTDRPLD
jgi:short-subunit dehydrogenase